MDPSCAVGENSGEELWTTFSLQGHPQFSPATPGTVLPSTSRWPQVWPPGTMTPDPPSSSSRPATAVATLWLDGTETVEAW